jgi:hypothetical protein
LPVFSCDEKRPKATSWWKESGEQRAGSGEQAWDSTTVPGAGVRPNRPAEGGRVESVGRCRGRVRRSNAEGVSHRSPGPAPSVARCAPWEIGSSSVTPKELHIYLRVSGLQSLITAVSQGSQPAAQAREFAETLACAAGCNPVFRNPNFRTASSYFNDRLCNAFGVTVMHWARTQGGALRQAQG